MLKRITYLLFISLWITSITGVTLSKHYCGEFLVSVNINHEAESCCDKETGCCHNENERFEVKGEFMAEQGIEKLNISFHDNLFPQTFAYISNIPVIEAAHIDQYKISHPPPKSKEVLSELQTFRC